MLGPTHPGRTVNVSQQLYQLGRACFRARRWVLAGWMLLLVSGGALLGLLGDDLDESFSIPGTPAQQAIDDLARTFPQTANGAAQVVVHLPIGSVEDAEIRQQIVATLGDIAGVDGVAAVTDPFTGQQVAAPGETLPEQPAEPAVVDTVTVSDDGSTVISQVQFDEEAQEVPEGVREALRDLVSDLDVMAGTTTYLGGEVYQEAGGVHLSPVELVGIAVALLVLTLTFRSVVVAAIPVATALVGVGIAMAALLLSSHVIEVSSSAPPLGMMIGLAVGIDYALFIVSRYRELLEEVDSAEEAVARAVATAGSAVVFAGVTVVLALAGLAIARIPFLTVMGLGAAGAVCVAVAVALTLLPAVLGFAGDRLRPPAHQSDTREGLAARWSEVVRRGRWGVAVLATALLTVLALPATDLRLNLPDSGDEPAGSSARKAYELVSEKFGPGYNGPLTVSANILASTDPLGSVEEIATFLAGVDGVEAVVKAVPNPSADTAVFSVVPEGEADDPATQDLVRDLRDLATGENLASYRLAVTGTTAVSLDVSERMAHALLPFGAVVIGLSLLLLALVFRSLLVPLTASIGYVLSSAAAFGVVTTVFVDGWAADLVGVEQVGPIVSFLPIMLMGVLFGLAMDYQVFLVSRMREHYTHHRHFNGSPDDAVDAGIRQSSAVVVAAAAIMVGVFAAFVPTGDAVLKPIAFALAVGVLLDAFIVRLALIPALMSILGHHSWWLPAPLGRRLPKIDVEGAQLEEGLARRNQDPPRAGAAISLRGTRIGAHDVPDLDVPAGGLLLLEGPASVNRSLLWAIAGRGRADGGDVYVGGRSARRVPDRVGLGGIGGWPARQVGVERVTRAEPRTAEIRRSLDSQLLAVGVGTPMGDTLKEVVLNLAFGLVDGPDVVVVDLPEMASPSFEAAWQLLRHVTDSGTTLAVAVARDDVRARVLDPDSREVTRS
jgi:putative drug exporter of the RND superfamily